MLKEVYEFAKQTLLLAQETQRTSDNVKELQRENRDLRRDLNETQQEVRDLKHQLLQLFERLTNQTQHNADNERHEREKLALQLRNELLSEQLRLPPKGEG